MDPAKVEPDVLGKIDALLTRHRTGAPAQRDIAAAEAQAARAGIPILTEIITEDSSIPVLTEAVPATADNRKLPSHIDVVASERFSTDDRVGDISHDEEALLQTEELMVRDLENRIALEFTATLDRALNELLDHTREHIRYAVREALKQQLGALPHSTDKGLDQP